MEETKRGTHRREAQEHRRRGKVTNRQAPGSRRAELPCVQAQSPGGTALELEGAVERPATERGRAANPAALEVGLFGDPATLGLVPVAELRGERFFLVAFH